MASGLVCRANRPNTWLHRPACKREEKPCQLGAVHTWHEPVAPNICATRPFSGSPGSLTCPDDPEQKAKCQRQSQRRIGALLQGLVDRIGHVVADFADRLDCFPSLVLSVRDDTSDVRTRRHGSILSYGMIAVEPNADAKVPRLEQAAEDVSLC